MTKPLKKNNPELPKFAIKGTDLPRRAIYSALREIWFEMTELTNKELATALDVTPQSCSTMATGSDRRIPPYWILMRLCFLTDRHLVIKPDEIQIVKNGD